MALLNAFQFLAVVNAAAAQHTALPRAWAKAAADLAEQNLTVGGRYAPGTPVDTGFARSRWTRREVTVGTIFENDAPYIGALERGHSRQAPRGMRGLVELHWDDIQRDALEQVRGPKTAQALG